jgi:predicted phosphodiesterase
MPDKLVGLISDTHGVYDPQAAAALSGVDLLLHAGDVGHHGGHEAVLAHYRAAVGLIHAVRGNVDEGASEQELPPELKLEVSGWRVLVTHICRVPAAAAPSAEPQGAQVYDV